MNNWRQCKGIYPRLVAFGCRRGWRWARRLAAHKIRQEVHQERMAALFEGLSTSRTVIGHEDENGRFVVRAAGEEREP